MRKKTSVIWAMPSAKFRKLVKKSESYTEILQAFGKENKGGNFYTLKQRLEEEKIDVSHIENSKLERMFGNNRRQKIPLRKILVKDSSYNRTHLKARLLAKSLLSNECAICGMKDKWQEKPLVLVLDHINGKSRDNRIKNLRLLCPNCDSQTETFAGRNWKR